MTNSNILALRPREPFERPGPIPDSRMEFLLESRDVSLTKRQSSSTTTTGSSAAVSSCGADDTSGSCERPTESNPISKIAPIVLGIIIPLVAALVILVILHRRNVKKLRREDAQDRQKSLDFGLGPTVIPTEKKRRTRGSSRRPEMSTTEVRGLGRGDRGLSLDLSMANPYLLPPELQHSRESLHSLSRNGGDDKYRATNFIPDDGSIRSPSSLRHHDDASIYTYSSRHHVETESTKGLITNGARSIHESVPVIKRPTPAAKGGDIASLAPPALHDESRESYLSTNSENGNLAAMRASNNYLGQYISGGAKNQGPNQDQPKPSVAELDGNSPQTQYEAPSTTAADANRSKQPNMVPKDAGFDFDIPPNTYELASADEPTIPQFDITPAENIVSEVHEAPGHEAQHYNAVSHNLMPEPQSATTTSSPRESSLHPSTAQKTNTSDYGDTSDYYDEEEDSYDILQYREALGYDPRLLTMGMRPLPPDDPSENPEERALRIRSFYKEYFEDTAKSGGDKARLSYFDGSENYIDDYYGSQNHGYDAHGYNQHGYGPRGSAAMSARGHPGRHRALSNGSYLYGGPGPRAHSSASQRIGGPGMRPPPKKRLPPAKPLSALRNPATLKSDLALMNSTDFAPPQLMKDGRPGTSDGTGGGRRPFSPATGMAFNPLASSFDDLSVLPSPHHLRKSGTFTSLDFALPRFANAKSGSDAGSIRSNQSGMSAVQLHNLRAGAYRVSRIPKEVAGTKEELADALKPSWTQR